jgi:hypothetical protein
MTPARTSSRKEQAMYGITEIELIARHHREQRRREAARRWTRKP